MGYTPYATPYSTPNATPYAPPYAVGRRPTFHTPSIAVLPILVLTSAQSKIFNGFAWCVSDLTLACDDPLAALARLPGLGVCPARWPSRNFCLDAFLHNGTWTLSLTHSWSLVALFVRKCNPAKKQLNQFSKNGTIVVSKRQLPSTLTPRCDAAKRRSLQNAQPHGCLRTCMRMLGHRVCFCTCRCVGCWFFLMACVSHPALEDPQQNKSELSFYEDSSMLHPLTEPLMPNEVSFDVGLPVLRFFKLFYCIVFQFPAEFDMHEMQTGFVSTSPRHLGAQNDRNDSNSTTGVCL